jgi:hypothetical protein
VYEGSEGGCRTAIKRQNMFADPNPSRDQIDLEGRLHMQKICKDVVVAVL